MATRLSAVSSPSRKWYRACTASLQSVTCRVSHGASPTIAHQAPLLAELVQPLLQRSSSAMQTAHHGADRDIEDIGDLLVGEALDVGQQHSHAELLGEGLDGLLHLGVGEVGQHLLLRALADPRRLEATEAAVEVEVLDVL